MSGFQLHPQLQQDCHQLGQINSARLLLHRNATVPWFILVPETEQLELLLLPPEQQTGLLTVASQLAQFLLEQKGCQRTNFAAIGNLVPQMHLHIVGRKQTDPCWPAPVWGHLGKSAEYTVMQLSGLLTQLRERLPELEAM